MCVCEKWESFFVILLHLPTRQIHLQVEAWIDELVSSPNNDQLTTPSNKVSQEPS